MSFNYPIFLVKKEFRDDEIIYTDSFSLNEQNIQFKYCRIPYKIPHFYDNYDDAAIAAFAPSCVPCDYTVYKFQDINGVVGYYPYDK